MSIGSRIHHVTFLEVHVIVLLESVHPDALALLERADEVRVMANPTELDGDVPLDEVRAVLTRGRGRITAEMCRRLPNVQVVGRCGAGLDNIDTVAARTAGIAVVHAPGRTTHAVSEHALLLMLALARRLTELDSAVKRGAWGIREGYEGFELRGKRLAVIGLGAIGRRVAEVGTVLGMNVAYWSRTSRDSELPAARVGRARVDGRCHPDLCRVDPRDARPDRARTVRPDEAGSAAGQHGAGADRRSPGAPRGDHTGASSAAMAPTCGTPNPRPPTIHSSPTSAS